MLQTVQIDVPDGFEFVRIGTPRDGEWFIDSNDKPMQCCGSLSSAGWVVLRKLPDPPRCKFKKGDYVMAHGGLVEWRVASVAYSGQSWFVNCEGPGGTRCSLGEDRCFPWHPVVGERVFCCCPAAHGYGTVVEEHNIGFSVKGQSNLVPEVAWSYRYVHPADFGPMVMRENGIEEPKAESHGVGIGRPVVVADAETMQKMDDRLARCERNILKLREYAEIWGKSVEPEIADIDWAEPTGAEK